AGAQIDLYRSQPAPSQPGARISGVQEPPCPKSVGDRRTVPGSDGSESGTRSGQGVFGSWPSGEPAARALESAVAHPGPSASVCRADHGRTGQDDGDGHQERRQMGEERTGGVPPPWLDEDTDETERPDACGGNRCDDYGRVVSIG